MFSLLSLSLILASLLAGEFARVTLGDLQIPVADIFVPLFFGAWVLKKIWHGYKPTQTIKKLLLPFAAFSLWALITLLANASELTFKEFLISASYWVRWVSYGGLLFLIADEAPKAPQFSRNFQKIFLMFFALGAILGLVQFKFFSDFEVLGLADRGYDPHVGRLTGTWLDPNLAGGIFVIGIIFVGNLLMRQWRSLLSNAYADVLNPPLKWGVKDTPTQKTYQDIKQFFSRIISNQSQLIKSLGLILLLGLLLVALGLTFSRSAYLAFVAAFVLFGIIYERKILIGGILAIVLLLIISPRALERTTDLIQSATALISPSQESHYFLPDETARLRLQNWEQSWEIFKTHPFFGVGYNTLRFSSSTQGGGHAAGGMDSSVLTILVTTGLMGLCFYIWFLVKLLQELWQKKSSLSIITLISVLVILFHSILVNSFFFPPILFLIFSLSGLGLII